MTKNSRSGCRNPWGRCRHHPPPPLRLSLAEIDGIVGLKDATGDIARANELFHRLPPGFSVYSGDDGSAAALMLMGAHGNISVTANILPNVMHQLCEAAIAGDISTVRQLSRRLAAINQALFVESNPIPVKTSSATSWC